MLLPALLVVLFLFMLENAGNIFRLHRQPRYAFRRILKSVDAEASVKTIRRNAPKPAWVKLEILRLKALMPDGSCRKIKDAFDRRFSRLRQMTVGRTYVAETIKKHKYEIEVLRKKMKRRPPRPVPNNHVWAMDLTGKTDSLGNLHMILGILDHGSRAALCLQALPNKSSWTLLGHLFLAIGSYGKPKSVRTDNEAVFCSRYFRMMLYVCGIRHQTTDLHCPWQNGRVERFFGTLKEKLNHLAVESFEALNGALGEYRFWYNHVRPHQNLGGRTPAEAWAGVDPYKDGYRKEYWFETWEGLLQGFYLQR